MGKIMLDTAFPNNPAWLADGGAYALALHLGALAYSDAQGLDGIIPKQLVPHLSLAVPPGQIRDSVDLLVEHGFWTEMSRDIYAVTDYERTNFTKAQADAFRDREAAKKRRQRLHGAGDHSLCTSAKWCADVKAREQMSRGDTRGTAKRDTRGSIPLHSVRPLGSTDGGVTGNRTRSSGPASAGAPASPPAADEKTRTRPAVATAENLGAYGFDVATLRPEEVAHIVTVLNEPLDETESLDGLYAGATPPGRS